MDALHEVGAIDKQTLREFDDAALTPVVPFSPEAILMATNQRRPFNEQEDG